MQEPDLSKNSKDMSCQIPPEIPEIHLKNLKSNLYHDQKNNTCVFRQMSKIEKEKGERVLLAPSEVGLTQPAAQRRRRRGCAS